MQTLTLTVEYDGTRYAGWKAAPKKENLDTGLGRIHTALARLLKRTYSYSVPQEQTLVFMQEGRFSAFRPLLPCCLLL